MHPLFSSEQMLSIQAAYQNRRCTFGKRMGEIDDYLQLLPMDEKTCLAFCYASMPVQDVVSYTPALFHEFVRHALMLRERSPFLAAVPCDIFLNYVLFYRVNNEYIENCRPILFDALWERIKDKSPHDAILETNIWCCEEATYQSTDERTASPLTTLRRAFGRCGEESVLLVSALRSIGVPARQCYTPRWAHCDDNHAWVEAYADGKWHYLGACEPEPVLNKGWFTVAASKAMLVHSKVFSTAIEGEVIASSTPVYSTVNNTSLYAKTADLTICITKNGKAVQGITVRCEIVNYSELFPLLTGITDEQGCVNFRVGRGDVIIHAHDGTKFIMQKMDARLQTSLVLDWAHATDRPADFSFTLISPSEIIPASAIILSDVQAKQREILENCARKRAEKEAHFLDYGTNIDQESVLAFLKAARGNAPEIMRFFHETNLDEALAILRTLRPKDLVDIRAETLSDYLACSREFIANYPAEIGQSALLAPRVENEMILPQRSAILHQIQTERQSFSTGRALWIWLKSIITVQDQFAYPTLICDAKEALRFQIADSHSLDILFVQIARALGFPARLNPVHGAKEIYESGGWMRVDGEFQDNNASCGTLTLHNSSGSALHYAAEISIGKLTHGVFETLTYEDTVIGERFSTLVEEGFYRVITTVRQIDGSVKCKVFFADVYAGKEMQLSVFLAEADDLKTKFKYALVPDFALATVAGEPISLFATFPASCPAILAFVEPGGEPTEHLLNEWLALVPQYRDAKIPIRIVIDSAKALTNPKLQQVLQILPNTQVLISSDPVVRKSLHLLMGVGDERLPFVMAIDAERRGLFAFSNYNVGTALTLLKIVETA